MGKGRTEAAGTLAGIFCEHVYNKLKFLSAASKTVNSFCNHFNEGPKFERSTTPKSITPQTTTTQTSPTPDTSKITSLSQTEPIGHNLHPMRLLEMFSATGAIDQSIQLSRRLRKEESLHRIPKVL